MYKLFRMSNDLDYGVDKVLAIDASVYDDFITKWQKEISHLNSVPLIHEDVISYVSFKCKPLIKWKAFDEDTFLEILKLPEVPKLITKSDFEDVCNKMEETIGAMFINSYYGFTLHEKYSDITYYEQ